MRRARVAPLFAVALLATGCSLTRAPDTAGPATPLPAGISQPPRGPSSMPGERLLAFAEQFVGAPYRYGGSTADGFDCSGLVVRTHELAGIAVPRTALDQHAAAQPVDEAGLRAGDLVFFASRRGRVDHVGIYAGGGRFVHAPRRGRPVGFDRLDDAWFATRFVGAGRFWTAPPAGQDEAAATGAPPGAPPDNRDAVRKLP
jgi:cell wall-associated NlpC family hydrolase